MRSLPCCGHALGVDRHVVIRQVEVQRVGDRPNVLPVVGERLLQGVALLKQKAYSVRFQQIVHVAFESAVEDYPVFLCFRRV